MEIAEIVETIKSGKTLKTPTIPSPDDPADEVALFIGPIDPEIDESETAKFQVSGAYLVESDAKSSSYFAPWNPDGYDDTYETAEQAVAGLMQFGPEWKTSELTEFDPDIPTD